MDNNKRGILLLIGTIAKEAVARPRPAIPYGAKEDKFNNAVALREYLEEKIKEYSTSSERC